MSGLLDKPEKPKKRKRPYKKKKLTPNEKIARAKANKAARKKRKRSLRLTEPKRIRRTTKKNKIRYKDTLELKQVMDKVAETNQEELLRLIQEQEKDIEQGSVIYNAGKEISVDQQFLQSFDESKEVWSETGCVKLKDLQAKLTARLLVIADEYLTECQKKVFRLYMPGKNSQAAVGEILGRTQAYVSKVLLGNRIYKKKFTGRTHGGIYRKLTRLSKVDPVCQKLLEDIKKLKDARKRHKEEEDQEEINSNVDTVNNYVN